MSSLFLAVTVPACGHGGAASAPKSAAPAAAGVASKEKASPIGNAPIDAALREAWQREKLTPAPRADDATFVRRAHLDLVGTIPPPEVTSSFLASTDPDKRKKLVERLLDSQEYADHWTTYWDAVLMGRDTKGNLVDRDAFRGWLRSRFIANAPWDRVVHDLISAAGENSLGGARVKATPMAMPAAGERGKGEPDTVNGAVNWTLRYEQTPQDLAGNASRVFLGVQIQCAQCHDHKTEKWKQDDFRRFASAFMHTKIERIDAKEKGVVQRVALSDAARAAPRFAKNPELSPVARAKATALDGTDLDKGDGTRKALAAWVTSRENPWFAKAIVNRIWGHMLGRGFYDPVDDIRPGNPAAMPELLDRVAADFVAHGYDLKYLLRTICATEAYNLASAPPPAVSSAGADDAAGADHANDKLWARFHLAPLGPEELLNALLRATNVEGAAAKAGIANFEQLRASVVRQYTFLFDVDEEDDEPDYSGTVTQALTLLNGALVAQGSRALPGSAIGELDAQPGSDAEKIDALVLRVLARRPTPEERERWTAYVTEAARDGRKPAVQPVKLAKKGPLDRIGRKGAGVSAKQAAYEDLLWALLNSSEFVFNH